MSGVLLAVAALLAGAANVARAGDPMDFWDTFKWNDTNDVTNAVSVQGYAGRELTEVVNVGRVNWDPYTDLLIRVGTTNYGLILGGYRARDFRALSTL